MSATDKPTQSSSVSTLNQAQAKTQILAVLPIFLMAGLVFSGLIWLMLPAHVAKADNIVVNSLTDDDICDANQCTLRGAINKARATILTTDTITINITGTIDLLDRLPQIDSPMAINGPGADKLIVRRSPSVNFNFGIFVIYRDVAVQTPITVSISSITISNGKWVNTNGQDFEGGGGIFNYRADVFLRNLVVTNNEGYEGGGGIQNDFGNMVIEDSTVSNNRASGVASRDVGKGGGIYLNSGKNIVRNVTVSNNYGNRGGGINVAGDSTTSPTTYISNSRIISNQATTSNANAYNTNSLGGGIGAGIPGKLFIDSTIISGNLAWGGGGMYDEGNENGYITITNSLFYGNTSSKNPVNYSAGCGQFNGNGGGYLFDPHGISGTLTIINSTFTKNKAVGCPGGALYTDGTTAVIANSTFIDNSSVPSPSGTSTARGGGIDNTNGQTNLYIANSVVLSNTSGSNNAPDDMRGTIISSGYNYIGTGSGGSAGWTNSDVLNGTFANAQLNPLQNNGSPILSFLPLVGSPLINAGNPNGCAWPTTPLLVTTDQRGFRRPDNSRCDIGAVEIQPALLDLNGPAKPGAGYSTGFVENSSPVSVTDPAISLYTDAPSLSSATIRITNVQDTASEVLTATAAGAIGVTYDSAGATLLLNGSDTITNYLNVLQTVKYGNSSDNPGNQPRLITFYGTSGYGSGVSVTATVVITPVNDAPVFNLPPQLTAREGITSTVAGLSLADPDAASGTLSVTLSVGSGSLSFGSSSGLTFQGGVQSGTNLTFSGTLTNLNTALASLIYSPTQAYFSGQVPLGLSANDQGNSGTGGPLTTNLNTNLSVLSALLVTSGSDSGTSTPADFGTLSYALNAAADTNRPSKVISFAGSLSAVTLNAGSSYAVAPGVTLQGRCGANGPDVELTGNGATALTLSGGATLSGLSLRGLPLRAQVVGTNGRNSFSCLRVSR